MAKRVSVDKWLFCATLLLVVVGLAMVFSASAVMAQQKFGSPYTFLGKQAGWAALGVLAMLALMRVDYRWYNSKKFVYPAMAVTLALLVGVFLMHDSHHTHRWIRFGGFFTFQPSEIAKPVLAFMLTFYPWRLARILAWLHPDDTKQGAGFQTYQSLIAVGTGGWTGHGYMEGVQKLFYLPEPHTDFIFANIAEEWGLLGSVVLVALFVVLGFRGFRAVLLLRDPFARLLAFGITMTILIQAFFNMSVVVGLLPTKGITLPFISSGGTSLCIMLACVGILLNLTREVD